MDSKEVTETKPDGTNAETFCSPKEKENLMLSVKWGMFVEPNKSYRVSMRPAENAHKERFPAKP